MTGMTRPNILSPLSLTLLLSALAMSAPAGVVIERWSAGVNSPHPKTVAIADVSEGKWSLVIDLKDLAGAKVINSRLLVSRPTVTGENDEANIAVVIRVQGQREPLKLIAPWFVSFDATEAVRQAVGQKLELAVESFPQWEANKTQLEVAYEKPGAGQGTKTDVAVQAVARAGQTFITFQELSNPFPADKPVTRRELDAVMRDQSVVSYLVFRHRQPIDESSFASAEMLAEVGPLSGWNVRGLSLDRLIYQHQLRALEDAAFARSIASGPFNGYSRSMPQMGEVAVDRLCVDDGKPLPRRRGLYVHQTAKAGKAYYAVVAMVNGAGIAGAPGWSTREAIAEEVGVGRPVLQGQEKLKVFYDYPGERRRYVQWCAPPLANLPNQYFNWGVYIPPSALNPTAETKLGLGVFFHDAQPLYLRPRWPHRQDMILISPQDDPHFTFGYGYHECLGTLRAFSEGRVRDYTARRLDSFIAWIKQTFPIDNARLSTHGMGVYGGTAALHYGLRHAQTMSLIVAGTYDADPKLNAATYKVDNYPVRKTHLRDLEVVWGKRDWQCQTPAGTSIWQDRDLPAWVRANPQLDLPFLSLGSGSMHSTWPQENALLKALIETSQPFWTGFTWGGEPPRFGPLHVRRDKVILAQVSTLEALAASNWGKNARWGNAALGYWNGGEIFTGLGWNGDDIVDTPDRLEVTVTGSGGTIAVRNRQAFKPAPDTKVRWEVTGSGQRDNARGEVTVDAQGRLIISGVTRGRLVLTLAEAAPTKPR